MIPLRWSRFLLALLLAISAGLQNDSARAEAPPMATAGAKRALLIGINKYKAVPKLQGSLNDIETMKQVLITRWGFPEANIRFLVDEQATREGMLAALNQFVNETGPNDTVYIHYSGHGSQVADLNGDEPDDKLDETLVPQDGRTGAVPDITDDELDAIFGRLSTKNAFIVLDSCHSGTATRSLEIRTRSIPQDTRLDLYRPKPSAEVRTRGTIQIPPMQYVLMTGAAAHQEALDGPVEGRYHGFFSYALSKSLSASPPLSSPRTVFRGIETELKRIQTHFGRASMPEPQLEAPLDLLERPLLEGAHRETASSGAARLAWIDVKPSDPGTVMLVNGLVLGAGPGSTWALYPPGDSAFIPGRALATATVLQLDGQHARAKVHPASKKIPEHARAVALMPASTGDKIPVHLLDVSDGRRTQIEQALRKQIPNVEFVGQDRAPRFMVSAQGSAIHLLASDGLQLVGSFEGDGDSWVSGLALVVTRSATASELLTLENPSSQLKIDVRVANAQAPNKPKVGTRGIAVVAADTQPARYRIRKPGKARTAENTLQLELKVNADSYISIVDVDSEGGVNLLFPNDYAKPDFYPNGFVRGGETVLIPDSLNNTNRAGFHWDYSPPKGMDTVRVFSSTDLETATMIRQRIKELQSAAGRKQGAVTTRSAEQHLESLRAGLANSTARGIVAVYDPTPHMPGQAEAESPAVSPLPLSASSLPLPSPVAEPLSHEPTSASPPPPVAEFPAPAAGPPPDWTAASVTIKVEG